MQMETEFVYLIRDNVSEMCTPPIFARNEASAKREFNRFLSSNPSADPADYDLHYLGIYDPNNICLRDVSDSRHVANGAAVVRRKQIEIGDV